MSSGFVAALSCPPPSHPPNNAPDHGCPAKRLPQAFLSFPSQGWGRHSGHLLPASFLPRGGLPLPVSCRLGETLPEMQSCHGRAVMLGSPTILSQSPIFLTNYFTHLQDKLDFTRPIRTQTERRYAAEPQGQLNAVSGDSQGPGVSQGSIFQ